MKSVIYLIKKLITENKKIIYITHNEEYIKKIFNRNGVDTEYIYFSNMLYSLDNKVKVDLFIIDDVSGLSLLDDYYIKDYVKNISGKKLLITMKKMSKHNVIYEFNEDLNLFKEPRSIQTKINLNYDMPHVVFEFLKWFMLNNTKVILITKDEESCLNVYNYMKKYSLLSDTIKNIFIYRDFDSFNSFSENNMYDSYIYLTTNCFLDELYDFDLNNLDNFNIVVFFACDKIFNYKVLLNICGIGNFLTNCKNEVIFVSNNENIEIIMSKVISRSYNKRIWESGMKKYLN